MLLEADRLVHKQQGGLCWPVMYAVVSGLCLK